MNDLLRRLREEQAEMIKDYDKRIHEERLNIVRDKYGLEKGVKVKTQSGVYIIYEVYLSKFGETRPFGASGVLEEKMKNPLLNVFPTYIPDHWSTWEIVTC